MALHNLAKLLFAFANNCSRSNSNEFVNILKLLFAAYVSKEVSAVSVRGSLAAIVRSPLPSAVTLSQL